MTSQLTSNFGGLGFVEPAESTSSDLQNIEVPTIKSQFSGQIKHNVKAVRESENAKLKFEEEED